MAKFQGLPITISAHDALQFMHAVNGLNCYYRSPHDERDNNTYVEFLTESDMLNACDKFIDFKHFKIKGIKRGDCWKSTTIAPPKSQCRESDRQAQLIRTINTTPNRVTSSILPDLISNINNIPIAHTDQDKPSTKVTVPSKKGRNKHIPNIPARRNTSSLLKHTRNSSNYITKRNNQVKSKTGSNCIPMPFNRLSHFTKFSHKQYNSLINLPDLNESNEGNTEQQLIHNQQQPPPQHLPKGSAEPVCC